MDSSGRLLKMTEDLQKKVEEQKDEIDALNAYKNKVEEYFSVFKEKKEVILFKIFKHIERLVPTGDLIKFSPVSLTPGTYIIESTITYINMTPNQEAGAMVGIYMENDETFVEEMIATGSASWFGRLESDMDKYSAYQTISVKGVLTITKQKDYVFWVKRIGSTHSGPVVHNNDFPCLLTIF
jgi:hypothetical protein